MTLIVLGPNMAIHIVMISLEMVQHSRTVLSFLSSELSKPNHIRSSWFLTGVVIRV